MMFSHRPNGSGILRGIDPGWKLVKGTVTIHGWGSTLQFHRMATARFQVVFELTEHQAIIGYHWVLGDITLPRTAPVFTWM